MSNGCHISFGQKRHEYEPRYDLVMPPKLANFGFAGPAGIEAFKNKVYIHDICVRCGDVVKRKTENGN